MRPADGSGVVVAASTDGKVHASTLSTGAPKWTTAGPSDTGSGSPVVVGSDVIVPGAAQLQYFNLSTGALRWAANASCASAVSTPAVPVGNIAYTCHDSGGDGLLNVVSTGGTLLPSVSSVTACTTSAPAILGGTVYTLFGGQVEGRSYSGFYQKWAVTPPFAVYTDAVAGDGLVVTCGSGGIFVVNGADGSTRFSNSSYPCTADPAIANGVINEPQPGEVAMFDEFGNVLGRLGTGGPLGRSRSLTARCMWRKASPGSTDGAFHLPRPRHAPTAGRDVRLLHPNRALKPHRRAS